MKKEFCRANLTGILYANRPSFLWSFFPFFPLPHLSLSTFHSWSHQHWKGVSRVVAVCVDPPHPPKQLMVGLVDVWIWRGDLTLTDCWRLSQKVEGVFMIASFRDSASYALYSVLIVGGCWRVYQACVRLCEFLLAGLGFVASCFCFSRAWLLEWDCDLKWNEFPSWWCLGFRLLLLFVFCLAF